MFQVVFEGVRGGGYQGDIAIDDVKITPGACAGVGTCSFEKDTCGWIQRQDDKFDWIRRRGTTPSAGTGPSSDHTLGTSTGRCDQSILTFNPVYQVTTFKLILNCLP